MALQTLPETQRQESFVSVFLKTALVAGTLDILSALTHAYIASGTGPAIIFKYIASGLFGPSAFSGGTGMIIAGLIIHYLIAAAWTLLFLLIYPKVGFLSKSITLSAIVIGALIWLGMKFLVLPLTLVPKSPFNPVQAAIGAAILIVAIGVPVSYFARRYYSRADT